MLVAGLILLVLFLYRCSTHANAVISRELLFRRPFLAAFCYNFVYGFCGQNGVMSLVPLYATSVYGMSTLASGMIVTPDQLAWSRHP